MVRGWVVTQDPMDKLDLTDNIPLGKQPLRSALDSRNFVQLGFRENIRDLRLVYAPLRFVPPAGIDRSGLLLTDRDCEERSFYN